MTQNVEKWVLQWLREENVEAVRNTDLYTSMNTTEYAPILPVFNEYLFWIRI